MSDTTSISPDLQACLVCDDVRQENTGKFILIGTFEGLASTKFPFMAPPFCIFTRWVGGAGNFKQSVALFAPDGITKIGRRAFSNNRYIREISLPEGIVEIGEDSVTCTNSTGRFTWKP